MDSLHKNIPLNGRGGLDRQKEKYLFVFAVSFIMAMAVFLPVIIMGHGLFTYYGDFNAQQLMFYDHVQTAAKEGGLNWDWGTDLGSSFIGSYSFYLLGSPFFWLTVLFPKGAAPYLIPWLLALKTAVAAVTSYAYIRRFVKSREASCVGAFLYAFSGFQIYNVFFNHFHDVTAFFPLLLLALELNVQENRKGVFALSVALMATVNYFFFAGQVTFLLIYFLLRCLSDDFKINLKKFVGVAAESVIGVMISAAMLLPAVIAVIENPRVDSMLTGMRMVVYDDKYRLFRIVQSFFMLSDPPARSNLFTADTARWSSMAGYLPMFSMAGVIAFMKEKKGHWAKRVVAVCIVFAFIPFLNTSFYMFNSSYYARWYYMPILIMAMMTAYVAQKSAEGDGLNFKKGIVPVIVLNLAFVVIAFLPKENDEKKLEFFKIAKYYDLFWIQAGVTLGLLGIFIWFVFFFKSKKYNLTVLNYLTIAACTISCASIVWYGRAQGDDSLSYRSKAMQGDEQIQLEKTEGEFYRIDTGPDIDNFCMFWGYSSMRSFQSTVEPSIMEFYNDMGLTRDVASRIDTKYYYLRGMLSVKYYIEKATANEDEEDGGVPMVGLELIKETENYRVYENEYYIPMGFAYDTYITEQEFEELNSSVSKSAALADSLVITPQQYEKYSGIISKQTNGVNPSQKRYAINVEQHKAESCYYFKEDSDGFTARIDLEQDRLVFFSVPYSRGWTATVNGKSVDVENVSNGMMAVRVPAGTANEIRFDYVAPGFRAGIVITVCGWVLLIGYVITAKKLSDRKKPDSSDKNSETSE